MKYFIASLLVMLNTSAASAACRISNRTSKTFTIVSGNVSNQKVNSHYVSSIAPGKILGTADGGATIAGICHDGDEITIIEEKGECSLVVKRRR